MRIEAIIRELYGLSPKEFTAARDAKVAEAKKAGEREAAAELKKLRRPSVGAFGANLLARERPDELGRLVQLGEELRSAQERFDGEALRQLSRQRVKHLQSLEADARTLAQAFALEMSAPASEELRSTLEAALADPESAELLSSGTLQSGLHYSGLGPAGSSSNHDEAPARASKTAPRTSRAEPGSSARKVASARAKASDEARAAARDAEKLARRLAEAERQLERAGTEVARARTLLERKRTEEAELRRRVAQLAKEKRERERQTAGHIDAAPDQDCSRASSSA